MTFWTRGAQGARTVIIAMSAMSSSLAPAIREWRDSVCL